MSTTQGPVAGSAASHCWADIRHGNCLDIMPTLSACSVDMVLADPPYGTTACRWDSVLPYDLLWAGITHVAKRRAAIVMTASQPFTSALIMSNPRMYRYSYVWIKNRATGFLNAKRQPLRKTEDVLVFSSGAHLYIPQKTTGHRPVNSYTKRTSDGTTVGSTKIGISGGGSTERFPTNILDFPSRNPDGTSPEGNWHPTQKPVALMEYLIRTYTNEGDTVLDFTMGSGTTGVACVNTRRKFIGIELDAGYFEIARKRLADAQGLPPNTVMSRSGQDE